MTPNQTRMAKLVFAIGDAFPDAPVTLERAHHVTWALITIGKNRVAIRWSGDKRYPNFDVCTPEGYRRVGYMQTTAHANSPREVVACLRIYQRRGFDALFSHELDRRMKEADAHPDRWISMAQMKRSLRARIRRARPYVDTTPPSLKSVVEMTPAQLRKFKAQFAAGK